MKWLSRSYMALIFLILYAPILIVILFSFNESGSLSQFSGFSLYWYKDLFRNGEALTALKNSLFLAVVSSLLATVIGTLAAFSIYRSSSKREPIPYERQRELGLSRPVKVTGPSVSHEEAYPIMQRKKKGRVTSK